jgi:hypothetical protein
MRFRYLADPLFLVCFAGYFVNRWFIKPHVTGGFWHDHLNDLICIPFWVPPMLWLMRRLHCRQDDAPPRGHEILIPLLLWSLWFEVLAPMADLFHGLDRADPKDVLWYTVGALAAALFWRLWYRNR